jgi:NADPH:quinone reductase-like Zn-dependent oxidoreductase
LEEIVKLICKRLKTVSGVGSIACQLAKNVLGAEKVIATVSTSKMKKVEELLGSGVVDQGSFPS